MIEFFSWPNATRVRASGTRNWAKDHSDEKYLGNMDFINEREEVGLDFLSFSLSLSLSFDEVVVVVTVVVEAVVEVVVEVVEVVLALVESLLEDDPFDPSLLVVILAVLDESDSFSSLAFDLTVNT